VREACSETEHDAAWHPALIASTGPGTPALGSADDETQSTDGSPLASDRGRLPDSPGQTPVRPPTPVSPARPPVGLLIIPDAWRLNAYRLKSREFGLVPAGDGSTITRVWTKMKNGNRFAEVRVRGQPPRRAIGKNRSGPRDLALVIFGRWAPVGP